MRELNNGKKLYTNLLVWKEGQECTEEERLSLYNRTYFVCSTLVVYGYYAWLGFCYLAFQTIAECIDVNISAKDFGNVDYTSLNINKTNTVKLCSAVLIPPEPPPDTIIKNGFEYDDKKRKENRFAVSQTADKDGILI